jgi:glucan biosynthesis protein C
MPSKPNPLWSTEPPSDGNDRLDYLDATRAFALILGVVFHASLSYLAAYIGWAVQDVSTSPLLGVFITISHAFRLELFFLLAGFLGHLTLRRKGVKAVLKSRAIRIVIPFIVGWFLLQPLVVSGWVMGFHSLQGGLEFWTSIGAGFAELRQLPEGLFVGTHLWFLYYLALITCVALLGRTILRLWPVGSAATQNGLDQFVSWLSSSRWTPLIAVGLIIPLLGIMDGWGVDTPDKSLVPHVPVLILYGGFFGLGWLLDRKPENLERFARITWFRGAIAITSIGVTLFLVRFQIDPGHPQYRLAHRVYDVSYAAMMWTLVWLTIGLFRQCIRRSSPWVRYIADSSYWMYLIHLPIVIWLQVATAEIALHWSLKLPLVTITTLSICLITYDLFVRPTFIGQILNGRRRSRVIFARTKEP